MCALLYCIFLVVRAISHAGSRNLRNLLQSGETYGHQQFIQNKVEQGTRQTCLIGVTVNGTELNELERRSPTCGPSSSFMTETVSCIREYYIG